MPPELVDQFGNSLRRGDLTKEIAGPTVTGVRQILGGHPEQGLTPGRLASILREAEDGDAIRYLELAEAMEEKDLHYRSVIGTRKGQVAQLDITVEPASDAAQDVADAELVEAFIERDELQDELCDILDAVGKGFSATEIVWETSERQWVPVRLEWRFPQWFEFDRNDGRRLLLKTEEAGREPLAPFKFITHFHKSKSGLPIRGGLARAATWGYLFKNYDIKDWVSFAETYGQPLRVGKYHGGATDEQRRVLLNAVRNLGTDAAAIIPEGMQIEFVEAKISGSMDLFERLANFLDTQVSKLVLGQTTTTDAISGGHAVSKEHNEVREDIERSDARQLAATLNRDLVRPLVALNNGPRKAYPRLKIGRPEQVDVAQLSDALAMLVPIGLKVGQAEVRRKVGLEEPDDESDLLGAPAPAAPPVAPPPGGDEAAAASVAGRTCPGCGAPVVAAAESGAVPNSVDDLIGELLDGDGWEPFMEPLVGDLRQLAEGAESIEELRDRLAEALTAENVDKLGEKLAEAVFQGRLAGETGAPVTDDDIAGS